MNRSLVLLLSAVALLSGPRAAAQSPDHAAVSAVVRGFHDALVRGDSTAALAFLAADVRVLETGGVESRDDYRSGHLAGDIAFAKAVPSTRSDLVVTINGDVAWVTSTSRTTGTYRDRQVNSAGAELMVLSRTPEGWRIRAIHWSSRAIRTP
jgi:ketosteroid isomerase-like protein